MPKTNNNPPTILPYSRIVGQDQMKLALELAWIDPRIRGVLLSGQRRTGKSTAVRAFAQMMGEKIVNLPINATEDRVIGGWNINALLEKSEAQEQAGLLEEANGGILYIDEVNLLDNHIVNIILDVTATGILVIQREGRDERKETTFTLVGTMNPSEGSLRPQLLDRFGLMVDVQSEQETKQRQEILQATLQFDEACHLLKNGKPAPFLKDAEAENKAKRTALEMAKKQLFQVKMGDDMVAKCVQVAKDLEVEGHRGDQVLALAARACAARRQAKLVEKDDIKAVVALALQHRRSPANYDEVMKWREEDSKQVDNILEA